MFIIALLSAAFAWISCCCIFHQFVAYSSFKADKIILSGGKKKSFNTSVEIAVLLPVAKKIKLILRLEEYKKDFLQQELTTAGINTSPEQYMANAIAYSLVLFVLTLPLAVVFSPVLLIASFILAVFSYNQKMNAAHKIVSEKRAKIEAELPMFSSTIAEQLTTTRDIVKIFETYRKVCPKEFEEEITKTLADMKTGNHEAALRNFENRMGSYKLSEVVRGLIGVLNGNNQIMHFEILTNDLLKAEYEELRRKTQMLPEKLKPDEIYLFLGLAFMLVAIFIPFTMQYIRIFT
ncbi:MAG: hypothetical protein RR622_07940 [Hydrogenoanaerobacterium sp.]